MKALVAVGVFTTLSAGVSTAGGAETFVSRDIATAGSLPGKILTQDGGAAMIDPAVLKHAVDHAVDVAKPEIREEAVVKPAILVDPLVKQDVSKPEVEKPVVSREREVVSKPEVEKPEGTDGGDGPHAGGADKPVVNREVDRPDGVVDPSLVKRAMEPIKAIAAGCYAAKYVWGECNDQNMSVGKLIDQAVDHAIDHAVDQVQLGRPQVDPMGKPEVAIGERKPGTDGSRELPKTGGEIKPILEMRRPDGNGEIKTAIATNDVVRNGMTAQLAGAAIAVAPQVCEKMQTLPCINGRNPLQARMFMKAAFDRLDGVQGFGENVRKLGRAQVGGDVFGRLNEEEKKGVKINRVLDGTFAEGKQEIDGDRPASIRGKFGNLNVRPDGGWEYKADEKNPLVKAYGKRSGLLKDVFGVNVHGEDGDDKPVVIAVNVWDTVDGDADKPAEGDAEKPSGDTVRDPIRPQGGEAQVALKPITAALTQG